MITAEKILIPILAFISAYSIISFINPFTAFFHVFAAVVTACIIDTILVFKIYKRWEFPQHAIISGLIISLVLHPAVLWQPFLVALVAMFLKRILRFKGRNIFNPAGLSLLLFSFFFGLSWWGAVSIFSILCLTAAWRVRNLYESVSFLAVYAFLFYSYAGSNLITNYVVLFFAFVMVVEPVTTAHTKKGKIIFGSIVGLMAFLFSFTAIDNMLLALLVGNVLVYMLDRIK